MRPQHHFLFLVALIGLTACGGTSANVSDDGGIPSGHDASVAETDSHQSPDAPAAQPDASGSDGGSETGMPDASAGSGDAQAVPDAPMLEADAGEMTGPYGAAGPHNVTTSSQTVAASDTFTTTAYIPSGAGPFPVVILSSGFEQPGAAYAPYAIRLSSWGIVTFLRDDPGVFSSLTAINLADDVSYMVTTWLAATNAGTSNALAGKLDPTKVGLAGHSRGGQVALFAGEMGSLGKIQGVFGLDPVDTAVGGMEARTTLGSLGVPLALLGETTDSTGGVGGMPCAPAADNFLVLYQAASSPAVAMTVVNADHTMFEAAANCEFCTLCTAGTASQPTVLAMSVRYLTAFFARQLLGDTTVGVTFAGAGATQDVASGAIDLVSK